MKRLLFASTMLATPALAAEHVWEQWDVATSLAQAFASTEACDIDIDKERAEEIIRTNLGKSLSSEAVASLMYQVVVLAASQGVIVRHQGAKGWCDGIMA